MALSFNKMTRDEQRQYLNYLAENGSRNKLKKQVKKILPGQEGKTKRIYFQDN
jgi:hypothetical protein